jgi:DNA-binding CsgD family transcriptional regulator
MSSASRRRRRQRERLQNDPGLGTSTTSSRRLASQARPVEAGPGQGIPGNVARGAGLSVAERRRAVVDLMAAGISTRGISRILHVSRDTVQRDLRRLRRQGRLELSPHEAALVRWARDHAGEWWAVGVLTRSLFGPPWGDAWCINVARGLERRGILRREEYQSWGNGRWEVAVWPAASVTVDKAMHPLGSQPATEIVSVSDK